MTDLPATILSMFDGRGLATKTGLSALLSTVDAAGWPHLSFLSAGEVVIDASGLALTLWAKAVTVQALEQERRGVLFVTADGGVMELRFTVREITYPEGTPVALIVGDVATSREHRAPYADVESLIGFKLHDAADTVTRWEAQVARMRDALA